MKTLKDEHPAIEQEVISKKIEEMISLLKERNQLIAGLYKRYVLPPHPASQTIQPKKEENYSQ